MEWKNVVKGFYKYVTTYEEIFLMDTAVSLSKYMKRFCCVHKNQVLLHNCLGTMLMFQSVAICIGFLTIMYYWQMNYIYNSLVYLNLCSG